MPTMNVKTVKVVATYECPYCGETCQTKDIIDVEGDVDVAGEVESVIDRDFEQIHCDDEDCETTYKLGELRRVIEYSYNAKDAFWRPEPAGFGAYLCALRPLERFVVLQRLGELVEADAEKPEEADAVEGPNFDSFYFG